MITIIVGTNRKKSNSRVIAEIYKGILQTKGMDSSILDLADVPADFIASALYENSGKNERFNDYRTVIEKSKKFVFIVAEYNGSFPGVLKAFIDGLKYPDSFTDKKCALVGLSSGVQGGGLAVSHLTDIFNYCGMYVLPLKPKLARIEANLIEGKINNDLYNELLDMQAQQLIDF
ncbi:NAD(P)H-dependent oxidoreductase [Fulvivirgaceae bacterium BMA10]|uniref:NAD(P)H-dependent oxidoreductase n=1 Tax=Splendidivirga corallicola TaxID=3051826 RepID=A0ABT8KL31_9BACT|nr:NAD(P)H-dependent oxidoreductase [Fulvivirgaceae bacterium BMA10]